MDLLLKHLGKNQGHSQSYSVFWKMTSVEIALQNAKTLCQEVDISALYRTGQTRGR